METGIPLLKQGVCRNSIRVRSKLKENNKMKNLLILAIVFYSFGLANAQNKFKDKENCIKFLIQQSIYNHLPITAPTFKRGVCGLF